MGPVNWGSLSVVADLADGASPVLGRQSLVDLPDETPPDDRRVWVAPEVADVPSRPSRSVHITPVHAPEAQAAEARVRCRRPVPDFVPEAPGETPGHGGSGSEGKSF